MTSRAAKIIVGVLVGVAALTVLAIVLFCLLRRKRIIKSRTEAHKTKNGFFRSGASTTRGDILHNGGEPLPWIRVEVSSGLQSDATDSPKTTDSNHNYEAGRNADVAVDATNHQLISLNKDKTNGSPNAHGEEYDEILANGTILQNFSQNSAGGPFEKMQLENSVQIAVNESTLKNRTMSSTLLDDHNNENFQGKLQLYEYDDEEEDEYDGKTNFDNIAYEGESNATMHLEETGQHRVLSAMISPNVTEHAIFPNNDVNDVCTEATASQQYADSDDTSCSDTDESISTRANSPSVTDGGGHTTEDEDTLEDLPVDFHTEVLMSLGEDWNRLFPERQYSLQYRRHRRNQNRMACGSDQTRKTLTL